MNETEGIFSILNLLNLNLRKGQAARSAHFGSNAILAENCRIHQHALAQRICFFLHVPAKNLSDMNAQQGKYLRFSAGHAITPPGSVATSIGQNSDFFTSIIHQQLQYASWHLGAIRFPVNSFQIHILSTCPCIQTQCCT